MASDLSQIIQEGLCSTLNGLLAKDAALRGTTKAHEKDLENKQTLKIDSTFEFDNITSTWSFIIPATTSSYIFNCMIADESEPVNEIDEDIADAINEFISTVSGGLTTTINGAEYDDLKNSKFTISGSEILESGTIEDLEHIYKFAIDLEGRDIEIFILFDNVILPFIEAIKQSPETVHDENTPEETAEDENAEEESNEIDLSEIENLDIEVEESNIPQTDTSEDLQIPNEVNIKEDEKPADAEVSDNDDGNIENKSSEVDEIDKKTHFKETIKNFFSKDKKLKIIIVAIGSLLFLTLLTAIILYFSGYFDPAEPIIDNNETNTTKSTLVAKNKSSFDIELINKKRLNARLEALTKYEILNYLEIEAQKQAEKERLRILNKETKLKEFASKNKEEAIKEQVNISKTDQAIDTKSKIDNDSKTNSNNSYKLNFILVHSLKYKLYKQIILQSKTKNARISICKNQNGRTAVYLGPFDETNIRETVYKLLKSQSGIDASLEELTQEEFNIRCNFE